MSTFIEIFDWFVRSAIAGGLCVAVVVSTFLIYEFFTNRQDNTHE